MHFEQLSDEEQKQLSLPPVEQFTVQEQSILKNYVTNIDSPVFGLINMPEVVKGALFARYSRSTKSLRRLLIDEFSEDLPPVSSQRTDGYKRAEALYQRVFQ